MDNEKTIRDEYLEKRRNEAPPRCEESLDKNKTVIIISAMVTLTAALISGRMSEAVYSGLMGSFLAFTFGRIFAEQFQRMRGP